MRDKQGKEITPKISKRHGKPVMVARIVYMEPELWDMLDRMARARGITRSTYTRAAIKKLHAKNSKIDGIDWSEVSYI